MVSQTINGCHYKGVFQREHLLQSHLGKYKIHYIKVKKKIKERKKKGIKKETPLDDLDWKKAKFFYCCFKWGMIFWKLIDGNWIYWWLILTLWEGINFLGDNEEQKKPQVIRHWPRGVAPFYLLLVLVLGSSPAGSEVWRKNGVGDWFRDKERMLKIK